MENFNQNSKLRQRPLQNLLSVLEVRCQMFDIFEFDLCRDFRRERSKIYRRQYRHITTCSNKGRKSRSYKSTSKPEKNEKWLSDNSAPDRTTFALWNIITFYTLGWEKEGEGLVWRIMPGQYWRFRAQISPVSPVFIIVFNNCIELPKRRPK